MDVVGLEKQKEMVFGREETERTDWQTGREGGRGEFIHGEFEMGDGK